MLLTKAGGGPNGPHPPVAPIPPVFAVFPSLGLRGQRCTLTLIVVAEVRLPETPVMVTVKVPAVALLLVARVRVAELVVGLGLKEAVIPLLRPEASSVTLPAKPLEGVTPMVAVPLFPRLMLMLVGDAVSVKFGAAVTVRKTVVESLRLPLTPLMLTVNVPVVAD